MTVQLSPGTTPQLSITKPDFLEHVEDDTYWGVPLQYFTFDGDTVTLDSRLATQLNWTIDEDNGHTLNIAAVAQRVTIDTTTIDINPGFFCSYVDADAINS